MGGGGSPPLNHQITNKKWLKSPYHQQKMAQITITKCPLRSPITKQKASNHHTFFSAQTEVSVKNGNFWHLFCSYFRSGIITKSPTKIAKSPSPQLLKITKSPLFSATNHQITKQQEQYLFISCENS